MLSQYISVMHLDSLNMGLLWIECLRERERKSERKREVRERENERENLEERVSLCRKTPQFR